MSKAADANAELIGRLREAESSGRKADVRRISEVFLRTNEGLVRRLAMRFGRPKTDEEKEDALQAARMGVLRALVDFDPSRGRFSTHAGNHIRDYVQRWTGKTSAVVRPRSSSMPASIAREAAKFRTLHGREPEPEDLGVTAKQMDEWALGSGLAAGLVDIDAQTDDFYQGLFVELTYDEHEREHFLRRIWLEQAWTQAVEKLSPRNRDIAEAVLMQGETTVDVAARHGLTHGSVVQICKRIESRLKRAVRE